MKKFNVCYDFNTIIEGFHVPNGAFYGKDRRGYWICVNHKYINESCTLELYRFDLWKGWIKSRENSSTVAMIAKKATDNNLWDIPVQYPRYSGIHKITRPLECKKPNIKHDFQSKKCTGLREANRLYSERHDVQIPLDIVEKAICHIPLGNRM